MYQNKGFNHSSSCAALYVVPEFIMNWHMEICRDAHSMAENLTSFWHCNHILSQLCCILDQPPEEGDLPSQWCLWLSLFFRAGMVRC